MAMQLYEATDAIPVSLVPILIFGPPGSWKTTLAQTMPQPITLDFDNGSHRLTGPRPYPILRFPSWHDHLQEAGPRGEYKYPPSHPKAGQAIPYQSLALDTGGRVLDAIQVEVIAQSPVKQAWARNGTLTMPGYGELGSRFRSWLLQVQGWGKDVLMLCHQDADKNPATDASELVPDLTGKMAWKEIHKCFDIIGRIRYDGNTRILDFNPSEMSPCCKNAAGWKPTVIPDLWTHKTFLADLVADAKSKLGKTAEASAAIAKAVEEWQAFLIPALPIEELNASLPRLSQLNNGAKKQAWHLIEQFAADQELTFDKKAKCFVGNGQGVPA